VRRILDFRLVNCRGAARYRVRWEDVLPYGDLVNNWVLWALKFKIEAVFRMEAIAMRNRYISVLVLAVALLIVVAPLSAHHANAVFDTEKTVTVKGTVTDWFWANPHCLLRFDVTDNGEVAHWVGETQAPINMIGNGWRRDSFKLGDEITVSLHPLRNGKPGGSIQSIVLPDGKVLKAGAGTDYVKPGGPAPDAAKPEEDPK